MRFFEFLIIFIHWQFVAPDRNSEWPVPYKRFDKRPLNDPYCQAQYTFCPTGLEKGKMPQFDSNDTIEVFALKAPVWEFKYGDLLKHFNVMHDAIGIRSKTTGVNYTLEWYELNQLLNCTFPHLINSDQLMWCNQGASCVSPGIDDVHWLQNGTLVKVAEMSGKQFQNYSEYVLWDNQTGIFYETWTVLDKPDGNSWFEAHDCATFVLNSFKQMAQIGVKFNKSVSLNYTMINLYSDTPVRLGNITEIKKNLLLHKDLLEFFSLFQPHLKIMKFVEHFFLVLYDVLWEKKFYLFYNYEYWQLPMRHPFIKLTYKNIPLPQN